MTGYKKYHMSVLNLKCGMGRVEVECLVCMVRTHFIKVI